jgi:hypothetical protein
MRILAEDQDLVFTARPFADGVGASLYVGVVDPDADPGPTSIVQRRNRSLDAAGALLAHRRGEFDLGAASLPKSPRVAFTTSPAIELEFDIPPAWHGKAVWLQLRPFADDLENETLYRPRRLLLGDDGERLDPIRGSARLVRTEKRDGGGLLVEFTFTAARDGTPPVAFLLRKTTGPGTIAMGAVDALPGGRRYAVEVAGLVHGGAYTFELLATTGAEETSLLTGIPFVGDAQGPPAVTQPRITEA